MKIVLIILAIIVAAVLLLVLKTASVKPTSAKTAKVQLDTSERAENYGKALSEMVKVETISHRDQTDREKFYEFHKTLEKLFPLVHENCEKHVFDGSILFRWKGNGDGEPILLMSHHDVVEANGVWQHSPFSGDLDENGKVWGRGAVDTKASLFCIFTSVEELIKEGYSPKCDVYIASSCTEEWSGDGAPKTVQYLKDNNIHLKLLLDEGGMIIEEPIAGVKGTYAMVGVVEKGYGDVKFTAKGKGGHASAPGKNTPLVRLGKFMADVEKKNPFDAQLTPTVREMFRRLAPNMDFGMKLIFANMGIFRPLIIKLVPMVSSAAGAMMRTTLAFTMAKGADGANVLPQEAYVVGNMRFIHHQDNENSIKVISDVAKKYDIETEVIYQDYPCPIVDFMSEEFRLVEKTINDIYPGVGVSPYVMTGGTDAKYYSSICENAIRFAPLYIDSQQYASIHGLDENIYSGTLPMGVDFYKTIIRKS
ncbi:MAG: M20/M25/M40 family metallo-hydrolase [Anaerofustis stercorihominis]|nr:M20/M25/M40 family metallo-hydrolase [Anaerofustis stercorihominis]